MRECTNPYIPKLSEADRKAGKYLYPAEVDAKGNVQEGFPCQRCEACRKNRRWRWVGRCLAEQSTSKGASFLTLTYGYDEFYRGRADRHKHPHPHASRLVYSDVQRWLKRVRVAGFPCSYMLAGELGGLKGRAHWHVAMFWKDQVPEHAWGRNHEDRFWHAGLVDWKPLHEANIAYICQYILPEAGTLNEASEFHKSTRPALGHDYFEARALQFVKEGLAPQDSVYTFPGVVIDKGKLRGKPKHFFLADCARDRFLRSFVRQWREHRGNEPIRNSEYVDACLERTARVELEHERWRDLSTLRNLSKTGAYYDRSAVRVVPRTGLFF